MSIVRENLLSVPHYTPYCGGDNCRTMPRTFFNGKQFQCPDCGWQSLFEKEFIKAYKDFKNDGSKVSSPLRGSNKAK